MQKELLRYPTPLSVKYGIDVRVFDKELFSLIGDLKDTMREESLDALSAFQIGEYHNVIVVKSENGELLELINPRIISTKNKILSEEKSSYYGDLSAKVPRYEEIRLVFQNRDGSNASLVASGELSTTIQRKIDYTFGATFLPRLKENERVLFEKKLEFGGDVGVDEYCPTSFFRDKILKFINLVLLTMLLLIFMSFMPLELEIWSLELYGALSVVVLNVFYFFYAQYEGKKYIACGSCQLGNIIGTCFISLLRLGGILLIAYFIVG